MRDVECEGIEESKYLYSIETHVNEDGSLGVIDFRDSNLPFTPERIFYIFGAGKGATRGRHAHKDCKQFFIQLSGRSKLTFFDRWGQGAHILDKPSEGFFAKELTWCEFSDFSEGSVLMVLASHAYDANDYIHDFFTFSNQIRSSN